MNPKINILKMGKPKIGEAQNTIATLELAPVEENTAFLVLLSRRYIYLISIPTRRDAVLNLVLVSTLYRVVGHRK